MSIQLTQTDFDHLVAILENLAEWRTEQGRLDLLDEVFAGSPRKRDVLRVQVNGTSRQAAVRVIQHLAQFGQDAPGRETLLVFAEHLCTYTGEGNDAAFLRALPNQYRSQTQYRSEPLSPGAESDRRATPDPQTIHDVLGKRFDLDELRDLCFRLNVDHEEVRGNTKSAFARELVTYMERRNRLPELVDAIRRARGNVI